MIFNLYNIFMTIHNCFTVQSDLTNFIILYQTSTTYTMKNSTKHMISNNKNTIKKKKTKKKKKKNKQMQQYKNIYYYHQLYC